MHESHLLREGPGAQVALERLLTGVDTEVNGQGSLLREDLAAVAASVTLIDIQTFSVA